VSKTQDSERSASSSSSNGFSTKLLADESDKKEKTALKADKSRTGRPSIPTRISRFVRETIGELRKVIWPTRKDLITYTIVTIIFITILVAFVWILDYGLAKAIIRLFGGANANDSGVSTG
jgi:preprotein translocase subunit SecE